MNKDLYNECLEYAKKCNSRNEFRIKYWKYYNISRKEKILDDFSWLKTKLTYWTKEKCLEESKKYNSKIEFQKNCGSAYVYARKHNLLKEMEEWFTPLCKTNGYWLNKENCILESKKYKNKTEFQKKCYGAYIQSLHNNWLKEMVWLKQEKIKFNENCFNYLIYSYEIPELNSVYVGLSKNLKDRHYKHIKSPKDTLYRFCKKNNIDVPLPKILYNNLTPIESQKKELECTELYIKQGWNIINIAKMGENISSIGGNAIKWTTEKIYEESKQYKTLKDYYENSKVYCIAVKKDLIKNMIWLKRNKIESGYWNNYEKCKNAASNCLSLKEFRKKYYSACKYSKLNNWLNDFFPNYKKREKKVVK